MLDSKHHNRALELQPVCLRSRAARNLVSKFAKLVPPSPPWLPTDGALLWTQTRIQLVVQEVCATEGQ